MFHHCSIINCCKHKKIYFYLDKQSIKSINQYKVPLILSSSLVVVDSVGPNPNHSRIERNILGNFAGGGVENGHKRQSYSKTYIRNTFWNFSTKTPIIGREFLDFSNKLNFAIRKIKHRVKRRRYVVIQYKFSLHFNFTTLGLLPQFLFRFIFMTSSPCTVQIFVEFYFYDPGLFPCVTPIPSELCDEDKFITFKFSIKFMTFKFSSEENHFTPSRKAKKVAKRCNVFSFWRQNTISCRPISLLFQF